MFRKVSHPPVHSAPAVAALASFLAWVTASTWSLRPVSPLVSTLALLSGSRHSPVTAPAILLSKPAEARSLPKGSSPWPALFLLRFYSVLIYPVYLSSIPKQLFIPATLLILVRLCLSDFFWFIQNAYPPVLSDHTSSIL